MTEVWDQPRWLAILDRIEHRQAGIGLRFWGPPLWLEVTMSGPDSDAWSVAGSGDLPDRQWDWQSSAPCHEAVRLVAAGASDEVLLEAASRYSIENLILNATHEIGEWLRFDAQRCFAAHGPRGDSYSATGEPAGDGVQGNGAVSVLVEFGPGPLPPFGVDPVSGSLAQAGVVQAPGDVAGWAARTAASWRFATLPGTAISYAGAGPVITNSNGGVVRSTWSPATHAALGGPDPAFVDGVQRDVHRALVRAEAGRICDAFYVDGRRPFRLAPTPIVSPEADPVDDRGLLHCSVTYAD